MEQQFIQQWGPAGFILLVLGLVVKWLMSHIDTLTANTKELVSKHLEKSSEATSDLSSAIKELKTVVASCNRK